MNWKKSNNLVPYDEAISFMENYVESMINDDEEPLIWLLEHPPLYTAGRSASESDLVAPDKLPVYESKRGGQYTYHGPGQRIVYLMLRLIDLKFSNGKPDIRKYVCNLEQVIINSLDHFGINGGRRDGRIGIWVDMADGSEAKIAALGVHVRKWITSHGIAININPDLNNFSGIVPCGIKQHGVTSMKDLGVDITFDEFDEVFKGEFEEVFDV